MQAMMGANPAMLTPQARYAMVQAELRQIKSAPILDPNFNAVVRYLDTLNKLIDAIIALSGPNAIREWLMEVTAFLGACQKRTFQRMPLNMHEKQAVMSFCTYWRRMTQPPFLMGRPECQIVVITLQEYIQRLP